MRRLCGAPDETAVWELMRRLCGTPDETAVWDTKYSVSVTSCYFILLHILL